MPTSLLMIFELLLLLAFSPENAAALTVAVTSNATSPTPFTQACPNELTASKGYELSGEWFLPYEATVTFEFDQDVEVTAKRTPTSETEYASAYPFTLEGTEFTNTACTTPPTGWTRSGTKSASCTSGSGGYKNSNAYYTVVSSKTSYTDKTLKINGESNTTAATSGSKYTGQLAFSGILDGASRSKELISVEASEKKTITGAKYEVQVYWKSGGSTPTYSACCTLKKDGADSSTDLKETAAITPTFVKDLEAPIVTADFPGTATVNKVLTVPVTVTGGVAQDAFSLSAVFTPADPESTDPVITVATTTSNIKIGSSGEYSASVSFTVPCGSALGVYSVHLEASGLVTACGSNFPAVESPASSITLAREPTPTFTPASGTGKAVKAYYSILDPFNVFLDAANHISSMAYTAKAKLYKKGATDIELVYDQYKSVSGSIPNNGELEITSVVPTCTVNVGDTCYLTIEVSGLVDSCGLPWGDIVAQTTDFVISEPEPATLVHQSVVSLVDLAATTSEDKSCFTVGLGGKKTAQKAVSSPGSLFLFQEISFIPGEKPGSSGSPSEGSTECYNDVTVSGELKTILKSPAGWKFSGWATAADSFPAKVYRASDDVIVAYDQIASTPGVSDVTNYFGKAGGRVNIQVSDSTATWKEEILTIDWTVLAGEGGFPISDRLYVKAKLTYDTTATTLPPDCFTSQAHGRVPHDHVTNSFGYVHKPGHFNTKITVLPAAACNDEAALATALTTCPSPSPPPPVENPVLRRHRMMV